MSDAQRNVRRGYRIPPFQLRWESQVNPLPLREVRSPFRPLEAPPWIETGNPERPFNFSEQMRALCADIAARYEPLRHIDVSRMLFAYTPSRNARMHGLQARVTPLRFKNGELTRFDRGVRFRVQQFFHDRSEILYVVTFSLPRFLNRTLDDKFVTIFHELFHISPLFNGDLRRHDGRYSIHTASQKRYDQEMSAMAHEYIQRGADPRRHDFLRLSCAQLRHRHGAIVGHLVPRPKLIPIRDALHAAS